MCPYSLARTVGRHEASSLVIAVAQPALVSYDVSANAQTQAAVVRRAGARVVVFPELSLTGYELDAPLVSPDDPRLAPIIQACVAAGALALVGAPLAGPCIGMLAVDSSDATVVYRKINLGAAEAERFVPAQNPAVLAVDGWRLGLAHLQRHWPSGARRGHRRARHRRVRRRPRRERRRCHRIAGPPDRC
ncbi:nitrilase-related carbon-nitrogen hydrolase [Fodinicola feengrottensis]|uniref:nitrilase-related carbon-nitrogen hydrolase n=1 Tax=Fodinicola feengrottensis TaxID=435914 RepID=UPI002441B07F|nr:nitrilase-related carbon-nitrogen hydrolase [Fodinicola feengrottensis]